MTNNSKEQKQPTIRVNVLKHGVWAQNGKCGVLAGTKAEAIRQIKELYPAEYLVIDVAAEQMRRNSHEEPKTVAIELSSEERMQIAAEMSKL